MNSENGTLVSSRPDNKPPADPAPFADNNLKKRTSPSPTQQRRPSAETLAPLEFLQNQRRGSITDPSLHAASPTPRRSSHSPVPNRNINPTSSEMTVDDVNSKGSSLNEPRPASPYVFGDATAGSSSRRMDISNDARRQAGPGSAEATSNVKDPDKMDVDPREPADTNGSSGGTKRKMSSDREVAETDIDPQLVGPGANADQEGPEPKRRGSTIDVQRVAQLNLNDRRYSVDSRLGPGGSTLPQPQWWGQGQEKRADGSFPGYPPPGYAADPHGRPPGNMATFSWPAAGQPPPEQGGAPPIQGDPNSMPLPPRPFEPAQGAPFGAMPYSVAFAPDRRASVPDLSTTGPAQQRMLRSRSRPPSRSQGAEQGAGSPSGQSPSSSADVPPESSAGAAAASKKDNSTPYSRSPELRVSHKLAERKRRKEMKDLFDELRDQLPADRGMKASKWEILSKAIDFIVQLKHGHSEMAREIEILRHELEGVRSGVVNAAYAPGGAPPPGVIYGQGPPVAPGHYPPGAVPPPPHPHPNHAPGHPPNHPAQPPPPQQQQHQVQQPSTCRPASSQSPYPPTGGPGAAAPAPVNGTSSKPTESSST